MITIANRFHLRMGNKGHYSDIYDGQVYQEQVTHGILKTYRLFSTLTVFLSLNLQVFHFGHFIY